MEALLLRVPEAASLVGVSRSRLYELLSAGEIESVKVGSSRLIVADGLRAWVERQRSEAAAGR